MSALADRLVVVTGASGNLGRAVVARLERDGARVVGFDRADADLSDERSVEAAFARVDARGELWGVVHTVGAWMGGRRASETDVATLDFLWNANVRPAFLVARAAMRRFERSRGGRLVTVGALTAFEGHGLAGALAYNASKAALLTLTRALAEEGRPFGILANAVAPGTMDTPQNRAAMPDADFSRWTKLEAVAEAMANLLSPSAGVTGAVLPLP